MVATAGRSRHHGQGAVALSGNRLRLLAALALLLPWLICCQSEAAPTLAAAARPLPLQPDPPQGHTRVPTRTATPDPSPTTTQTPSPTVTLPPTVTPTPTEPPTVRHLRIFDQLYRLVLDNYLYPDFNGLNWPAWGAVYREMVAAGMTDAEFHQAMVELVRKLDDGHSVFQPPAAARETSAIIHGNYQSVGIGVETAPRLERGTAVLLDVYPDSPAWNAGLRPHDSLLTLDGYPILDRLVQLSGPAGSTVSLLVQTPGQPPRQVEVVRALVASPYPVSLRRLEDEEMAVLVIRTFWDRGTAPALRSRLQEAGPLTGLVIDLRTNQGGSEYSLENSLRLFADGTLGHFTRQTGERPLRVTGETIHNSQTVPLILLIGRETSSYAEIFAGVLQSAGRARLVGTVTGGNVETIWPHDFEDGSRLWIAEEGFRPLTGGDWEHDGIVPDFYVAGDWADFTADNDTQLATALQLLRLEAPAP